MDGKLGPGVAALRESQGPRAIDFEVIDDFQGSSPVAIVRLGFDQWRIRKLR